MIDTFEHCELLIGGVSVPVCDLKRNDHVDTEAEREPLLPMSHEFTIDCVLEPEADNGIDLSALLKPPKVKADVVVTKQWFGGKLTAWIGEIEASYRGDCSIDLDGVARRFEWQIGKARIAWEPGAVSVFPCAQLTKGKAE